ncbi:MAG TPA: hypothetical protein VLB90_04900 [Pseudomonadales bacterium]|nr:hypothetical protein [Pseudomonadales bacterium]
MTVRLKSAALGDAFLRRALPVLVMSAAGLGLVGCDDSGGGSHAGSGAYYHGAGFYDPYYYGIYDYDDYDPVVLPPYHNNGGNRPGKPDKPTDDLKPAHPIVEHPDVGNRPEKPRVSPTSSQRNRSLPSRSRPSYMGSRGGMRGGGMRGGGGRGGGGRR